MVRAILAAAGVVCLAGGSAAAKHFETGNSLLTSCTSSDAAEQLYCLGYIRGFVDARYTAVALAHPYCLPSGVTALQLRDIAVSHLTARPEKRHLEAGYLVANAFELAFPCRPATSSR